MVGGPKALKGPGAVAPDGSDVVKAPEGHHPWCLLDIPVCWKSGFYIPEDIGTGGVKNYRLKYTFDLDSNVNYKKYLEDTKSSMSAQEWQDLVDFKVVTRGMNDGTHFLNAVFKRPGDVNFSQPVSGTTDQDDVASGDGDGDGDGDGASEPAPGLRPGFDFVASLGKGVQMHYKREPDGLKIAMDAPVDGWVSFAVGDAMVGADAIIGGVPISRRLQAGAGTSGSIGAYEISARSAGGISLNAAATSKLTNTEVLHEGGRTISIFTRPLDNGVKAITYEADTSIIYAFGSGSTLSYHGADKEVLTFNFATGAATVDTTVRDAKVVHGTLMIISWGFLLPIGALAAAWGGSRFKNGGAPVFNTHRGVQSLGLSISIAGAIYALAEIYDSAGDMPLHGIIGLLVMVVGVLQPFNALFRPHGTGRNRMLWELLHKGAGRAAILLGLINCITGGALAYEQHADEGLFNAYSILAIIGLVLYVLTWVACYAYHVLKQKNEDSKTSPSTDAVSSFSEENKGE
jgi:hypothetical protein